MGLKILVCVKQVPATSLVEVDEDTGVLKRDGVAAKLNPYDLFALELALRLREEHGGEVAVMSMGPPSAKDALYEALCMGADTACLLSDRRFAGADVLATSRALAGAARIAGDFDLIVCGKQTTDGDTAQVGPALAEHLGVQHACCVHRVSVEGRAIRVTFGLGDGELEQLLPLPSLVTVEKDANTPRLPGYRRSLAVSPEDIRTLDLDDLEDRDESRYGLAGSPTQVERIFPPEPGANRETLRGDASYLAKQAAEMLRSGKYI